MTTDLGIELAHTFEGNSVICCVKFSNDGEFLATGCNRKAQVYKVSTGEIAQLVVLLSIIIIILLLLSLILLILLLFLLFIYCYQVY